MLLSFSSSLSIVPGVRCAASRRRLLPGLLCWVLLGALGAALPARAGDGVLEISQSCATATGCFPGDGPGLPVTIDGSAGRSVILTSDLVVPDASTIGIDVAADDVAIDLNGFAIRGPVVCGGTPVSCTPSSGSGTGIRATSGSGTSVRGGTIAGMGFYGLILGDGVRLRDLQLHDNRLSGIFTGSGAVVQDSRIWENGFDGVFVGAGSTVSGNVVRRNGNRGIATGRTANVVDNAIESNGNDGISAGIGSLVARNSSGYNAGAGIRTSDACHVEGNVIRANQNYGLILGFWSGFRANTFSMNSPVNVTGSGLDSGDNLCNGASTCF